MLSLPHALLFPSQADYDKTNGLDLTSYMAMARTMHMFSVMTQRQSLQFKFSSYCVCVCVCVIIETGSLDSQLISYVQT